MHLEKKSEKEKQIGPRDGKLNLPFTQKTLSHQAYKTKPLFSAVGKVINLTTATQTHQQGILFDFMPGATEKTATKATPHVISPFTKENEKVSELGQFQLQNRRFIGSKYKLLGFIERVVKKNTDSFKSFCDLFAGTGVVGAHFNDRNVRIISNDTLYSSNVILQTFLGIKSADLIEVSKKIDYLNNLVPTNDNYFSMNFGDKYFTLENAIKIGAVREEIEVVSDNESERNILLTSLIYATDKVANTVGHYDAYRKKLDSTDPIKLQMPKLNLNRNPNNEIYREDANLLAKKIHADVMYIDPPYNSRQYNRFYHVLENLVKWKKPKLYGVALKPESENSSEYCKVKAPEIFGDLIQNLKCSLIVVSYNNTYNSKSSSSKNKIKLEEINDILSTRGETKIYKKQYRHFNSGKTDFNNHHELLFVTKVNNGE